jgi:hypothetical protein
VSEKSDEITYTRSNRRIFADLGLPGAEELQLSPGRGAVDGVGGTAAAPHHARPARIDGNRALGRPGGKILAQTVRLAGASDRKGKRPSCCP